MQFMSSYCLCLFDHCLRMMPIGSEAIKKTPRKTYSVKDMPNAHRRFLNTFVDYDHVENTNL